jgi:hypothetical protein
MSVESQNRAVLCPNCEHLNSRDLDRCVLCNYALFMECQSCGGTNERVRSRCISCGKALFVKGGRLLSSEIRMASLARRRRVLVLAGVIFICALVFILSRYFNAD